VIESNLFLTGEVAFYSYMSQSKVSPGKQQTIIFDMDITNLGGHYSRQAGIFISPDNGVYTFTWSIYCFDRDGHSWVSTELIVNSNPIAAAFCHGMTGQYAQTSENVVVQMGQGDIVYLRTHPTHNIGGQIYSHPDAKSSFSGWKLFW
jgi:hypothetical protein